MRKLFYDENNKPSSKRILSFVSFGVSIIFAIFNNLDMTIVYVSASAGFAGVAGFQTAFKR